MGLNKELIKESLQNILKQSINFYLSGKINSCLILIQTGVYFKVSDLRILFYSKVIPSNIKKTCVTGILTASLVPKTQSSFFSGL